MTTSNPFVQFGALLSPSEAENIVRLCEDFGRYGMYSEEGLNQGIGEGLPQRFDAAFNYIKTGGRFGRHEALETLAARTNYFRETYAYGWDVRAPGIEPFLKHEGMIEAARKIHGREVIEPAIVYANLLVPGQELAVHTDVPEFRGANRKIHPEWLLAVMHHSGLFREWWMPIATCVAWFHQCKGGEFVFYPNGPDAAATVHPVGFNTALLMDTDSIFHGIDRMHETNGPIPPFRAGMQLCFEGKSQWVVRHDEEIISSYTWGDLRLSISWKAYCFRDEAERQAWSEHSDDLSLEFVLDRLTEDLRKRGRIGSQIPDNRELALTLADEYIVFPKVDDSANAQMDS